MFQQRRERKREQSEIESVSSVLDPDAPLPQPKKRVGSSLVDRINKWNPFGKDVTGKDAVWLLDNTAFQTDNGQWRAEFVAAVFKQHSDNNMTGIVTYIAELAGLADDDAERQAIRERLLPFLTDVNRLAKTHVSHVDKQLQLGPTGINGLSTDVLDVSNVRAGSVVTATAKVPRTTKGMLQMNTFYAGPEGWSIISDIDDTIKITLTSDPTSIIRETFVNPPTPVEGMPELYASIKALLPRDTPWFYLSASPYQLYPMLRQFRNTHFPGGTLILRDPAWNSIAGLIASLATATEEYKVDRMDKIHSWLPRRKIIAIGDSTQSDPEAYGRIYQSHPGWIRLILIRKVTDIAAVGIKEKNEPERFEKAFEGIPREAWHVFEEPSECLDIIQHAVGLD
ncbi:hypothetical protein B0I35DRAFT_478529 [Stachybotrys elegans]|uniref:Phosphatidate phosphatase APP1 catalytic domain-containing protein n=1 Tax=Stachybotrys elegans TaxID=80388 RepID=A0A8K0WRS5_9HYPO|nr:hypothetical protein B0I35DRAFT_478529 [Stachybotrys elegans]